MRINDNIQTSVKYLRDSTLQGWLELDHSEDES